MNKTLLATASIIVFLSSCQKEQKPETLTLPGQVSQDVIAKVEAQGFNTEGIVATDGGYIVEGDIFLSNDALNEASAGINLRVGEEEQYHTKALISGLPRVITVSCTGLSQNFVAATDSAIARYNSLGLRLKFQRVASGADIDVHGQDLGGVSNGGIVLGRSAGFPDRQGNPPSPILLNSNPAAYGTNPNVQYLATVISHEMGHCIGFRHTDYKNRAYSCGGTTYNEGKAGVGAIWIPGTPKSVKDPNSWMLACISGGQNRPFNLNDITALTYLYK